MEFLSDMEPIIRTTLYIEPKSKSRPRGAIVGKGKKQHIVFYPEAATAEFERQVAFILKGAMDSKGYKPTKEPVVLFAKFYCGNKRKIDVDNLLKALLDGANEVLFNDDSQIQGLYSSKHYSKDSPRIELELHTLSTFKKFHHIILDSFIQTDVDNIGQL